jgi:tRNA threonylcarbamoyladenosine biosynthesis protein TsaB
MVILALETATRAGSVAVSIDARVVAAQTGDPTRTHGERLPTDLMAALASAGLGLTDVDLYAVATGPGSFTGLRVGIATIQGLALAQSRRVVTVPTLDALAAAAASTGLLEGDLVLTCLDAQRQEVFGALYEITGSEPRVALLEPASVGSLDVLLDRWGDRLKGKRVLVSGDLSGVVSSKLQSMAVQTRAMEMPIVAATIAQLASRRVADAILPHAIRPVYVRRSDAELARDRRQ